MQPEKCGAYERLDPGEMNHLLLIQMQTHELNGLKSLIDAIVSVIAAVIDSVTTVNPGDQAAVTVSVVGNTLHFTFAIPKGTDGAPGTQGIPGIDGATGAQGPPFAQALIDSVTTLPPGTPAFVTVSFDGTNVKFAFGIPMGFQGDVGPEGQPGEVTNAALAAAISTAISGTSTNTNAVATMDTPFANDPPTLADMELMRAKYNELVLAARR